MKSFLLIIGILICSFLAFYFFYPWFIFEVHGFNEVTKKNEDVKWDISVFNSFVKEEKNFYSRKMIYGSPYDLSFYIKSDFKHTIKFKKITAKNKSGEVLLDLTLQEMCVLEETPKDFYSCIYTIDNIEFDKTDYYIEIQYSIDQIDRSIILKLTYNFHKEKASLFMGSMSI